MHKFPPKLSIVCKKYYKQQLFNELHSNAYDHSLESRESILERHRIFNHRHHLEHVDNLPYLYGTPKMHKIPPKFRFIAGVHTTVTVPQTSGSTVTRIHHRASHNPKVSTTAASVKLTMCFSTNCHVHP